MSAKRHASPNFACRLNLALAGVGMLIAASWAVPAHATDVPLTRSQPVVAVPAPAKAVATRAAPRVSYEKRASRAAKRELVPPVRMAAVDSRQNDCLLFFCWRNFPLILGVGY